MPAVTVFTGKPPMLTTGGMPYFQDLGLVFNLTGGDAAIAFGQLSLPNFGLDIRGIQWASRLLIHLKCGGPAQALVYRADSDDVLDQALYVVPALTFAAAASYPLQVDAFAPSSRIQFAVKNTDGAAALVSASIRAFLLR